MGCGPWSDPVAQDCASLVALPGVELAHFQVVVGGPCCPLLDDMHIAIASCAMERHARLWTLNPSDFRDLPGLMLYEPRGN